MKNLRIFKHSLCHAEPIIDEFYVKKGNLLISKELGKQTKLMENNSSLIECVSAYNFAKKNKNRKVQSDVLRKILSIMGDKNINYSEFVSFWPVVDISHSAFMKMTHDDKIEVLKNILDRYIELRHSLYLTYGYSPTTLQVGKDAKAHKESGNLGIIKMSSILNSFGFKKSDSKTAEDFFSSSKKQYIETDKKGKKLFKEIVKKLNIKFSWSDKKEGKMPDMLIYCKGHCYVIEHKHMKESGGGQDKQVNEIISFIGYSEKNPKIHYVSFLDGVYFNLFTNKNLKDGKLIKQINNIKKNLRDNPGNFFLNTGGFIELVKLLR